jgi:hypothetical protein
MDWQTKVGLGFTVVFGLLPFEVRTMPHWMIWAGLAAGILLIAWGFIPSSARIPSGAALLFIFGVACCAAALGWYMDAAPKMAAASKSNNEPTPIPHQSQTTGFYSKGATLKGVVAEGFDVGVYAEGGLVENSVVRREMGGVLTDDGQFASFSPQQLKRKALEIADSIDAQRDAISRDHSILAKRLPEIHALCGAMLKITGGVTMPPAPDFTFTAGASIREKRIVGAHQEIFIPKFIRLIANKIPS